MRGLLLLAVALQSPSARALLCAPIGAAASCSSAPRLHRQSVVASLADREAVPVAEVAPESLVPPKRTASVRELVAFVLPTLAGWVSSEAMSVVDTAVVGSNSAFELAALGPVSAPMRAVEHTRDRNARAGFARVLALCSRRRLCACLSPSALGADCARACLSPSAVGVRRRTSPLGP